MMADIRTLTTAPFFNVQEVWSQVVILSVVLAGGLMLSEFFVCPRTRRIDWWLIGLLLVSLLSFVGVGAAILGMHPGA
jgi:hypothetical protein